MIKAIVYTSNTGNTKEYAKTLSEKTGLPYYSLKEAKKNYKECIDIIYLGWVMASSVKGYKTAMEKFNVKVVGAVGMSATRTRVEDVRKITAIPDSIKLFTLQGGFDINKLHGIYKLMMKLMTKKLIQDLSQKKDKTKDDELMLNLMINGGSNVSEDNLKDLLKWYSDNK